MQDAPNAWFQHHSSGVEWRENSNDVIIELVLESLIYHNGGFGAKASLALLLELSVVEVFLNWFSSLLSSLRQPMRAKRSYKIHQKISWTPIPRSRTGAATCFQFIDLLYFFSRLDACSIETMRFHATYGIWTWSTPLICFNIIWCAFLQFMRVYFYDPLL